MAQDIKLTPPATKKDDEHLLFLRWANLVFHIVDCSLVSRSYSIIKVSSTVTMRLTSHHLLAQNVQIVADYTHFSASSDP